MKNWIALFSDRQTSDGWVNQVSWESRIANMIGRYFLSKVMLGFELHFANLLKKYKYLFFYSCSLFFNKKFFWKHCHNSYFPRELTNSIKVRRGARKILKNWMALFGDRDPRHTIIIEFLLPCKGHFWSKSTKNWM